MPAGEQLLGKVIANKACGAGYKSFHYVFQKAKGKVKRHILSGAYDRIGIAWKKETAILAKDCFETRRIYAFP